jgi:hypothetical protein
MKTHQLTLATLLLIFFLTGNLKAQPPTIDSLKIIPANPTANDIVKIIAFTSWYINPCTLTSYSLNDTNNQITVIAIHSGAGIFMPCSSIDTLTIGVLNAGNYELTYNLADTFWTVIYDIDTIIFTVQQASGLQQIDNSDQRIKVYPNPFSTSTTIFIDDKLLTSTIEIRMYDIFGREIKRMTKTKNKEITITKDNLTGGLYFIKIMQNDKIIDSKKIIID